MKTHLRAAFLILVATILFYWKILLVHQYSFLLSYEGTNQMYAWLHFLIATWRNGQLPAWDPFTFSGHAFAGEMQTGAFYPFYLLLLPFRFHQGMLSPAAYNWFFALTHVAGALMMYALCRTLGLRTFASILAGLCFSLGGFLARLQAWPHLLESAIWLPLIVLCMLRAMRARAWRLAVAWSALSGLALAMSILAGGLHLVIIDALLMSSAIVFDAVRRRRELQRTALLLAVSGGFAIAGGAVQLLPSAEYARLALRFHDGGASLASERIPYESIHDNLLPQGWAALIFAAPASTVAQGEYVSAYLGVFPVVLAVIGGWGNRRRARVQFFAGLAFAAYLYSLGSFSWLNGIAYALVPFLSLARESARFLYLADFAIAILAGFGIETILQRAASIPVIRTEQALRAIAACAALVILVEAGMFKTDLSPWTALTLMLMIFSWALLRYLMRAGATTAARFLVIALILFDLNAFDWSAASVAEQRAQGTDSLQRALSCRNAVAFLKSRPGPFRVEVQDEHAPNLGDLFGIETTWGAGVTVDVDYDRIRGRQDLFNARYIMKPAAASMPGAIYQDADWKIYDRANAFPRAWLVHKTAVESDPDRLAERVNKWQTDLRQVALLSAPLSLDSTAPGQQDDISFAEPRAGRLEVAVHSSGRSLLVLAELYYPGWKAKVNGHSAEILKVDGALRGVVVPTGNSRVSMQYLPRSVFGGAALTLIAFASSVFAVRATLVRRTGKNGQRGRQTVLR